MTKRGDINVVSPRDFENGFSGFERKFISVDDDNVLGSHISSFSLRG
jgi:hypothetical protein